MCGPKQDSCLFGHYGVDPTCTQGSPTVFGAFLHSDVFDKNQHQHLLPVLGTKCMVGDIFLSFFLTCFFLSFFLGFQRPNLITGLSGWRTPN